MLFFFICQLLIYCLLLHSALLTKRVNHCHSLTVGPERRETAHHETRHSGTDKVHILEREVERLSQTVLSLQTTVKELSNNLRTDLKEDTQKMLVTLLNNMRPPEISEAAGTEDSRAVLDGHQATRGTAGDEAVGKIIVRLNEIDSALQSKGDALEDLRGTMTSHEEQIRVLMEASQSQSPAITDLDVMQGYVDKNFDKLKTELEQKVEEQLVKMQSSCDDKISSVQKSCEDGHDQRLVRLTKLVDTKEADLRMEMQALRLDMADGPSRTQRQTDPPKPDGDHGDLWREIDRIAEAYRTLNMRIDNELEHLSNPQDDGDLSLLIAELDARMNVTEQNAETHCFYVEEKLSRLIGEEVSTLRQHVDERLDNMEDQFTNMLVEISNNSFPGMFGDSGEAVQAQVNNNKFLLQGLDDKINSVSELCSAGCSTSGSAAGGESSPGALKVVEQVVTKELGRHRNDMEVLRADVSENADKLGQLEGLLERHLVTSERADRDVQGALTHLRGDVAALRDSLAKQKHDVEKMNSTCCVTGAGGLSSPKQDERTAGSVPYEDHTRQQVEDLRSRLDAFIQQVSTDLSQCKQRTQGVSDGLSAVDGRVQRLEQVCGRLDNVSASIQGLKDGLRRHVGDLRDCAQRVNDTCGDSHSADIVALQNSLQKLQAQLSAVAKHVLKDITAKDPGELLLPSRGNDKGGNIKGQFVFD